MNADTRLTLLKSNLQIIGTHNDTFLTHLLTQAEKLIETEGITINHDDARVESAIIDYAAFLFRKRAAPEGAATSMPRFIRYELNNLLFSQKGADPNVT